jgi:hypothetical protein
MTFQLPPIVKAAEQLCVEIEEAVRRFERYHRNVIGTDLRRQAMHVYGLAERAWRDQAQQARWVVDLVWAIDELQRYLQVAKLLKATASFRQFEHLLRLIEALGKQAGGWRKKLHPNGQNVRGSDAVAQRAETLSTRAASTGANP